MFWVPCIGNPIATTIFSHSISFKFLRFYCTSIKFIVYLKFWQLEMWFCRLQFKFKEILEIIKFSTVMYKIMKTIIESILKRMLDTGATFQCRFSNLWSFLFLRFFAPCQGWRVLAGS